MVNLNQIASEYIASEYWEWEARPHWHGESLGSSTFADVGVEVRNWDANCCG